MDNYSPLSKLFEKQGDSLFGIGDILKAMEKMIRFTPTGGPYHDSTCDFKVITPKGATVKDIIEFALTQDEWGTISVKGKGELVYARGPIDTKLGLVKSDCIPEEVDRKSVV